MAKVARPMLMRASKQLYATWPRASTAISQGILMATWYVL